MSLFERRVDYKDKLARDYIPLAESTKQYHDYVFNCLTSKYAPENLNKDNELDQIAFMGNDTDYRQLLYGGSVYGKEEYLAMTKTLNRVMNNLFHLKKITSKTEICDLLNIPYPTLKDHLANIIYNDQIDTAKGCYEAINTADHITQLITLCDYENKQRVDMYKTHYEVLNSDNPGATEMFHDRDEKNAYAKKLSKSDQIKYGNLLAQLEHNPTEKMIVKILDTINRDYLLNEELFTEFFLSVYEQGRLGKELHKESSNKRIRIEKEKIWKIIEAFKRPLIIFSLGGLLSITLYFSRKRAALQVQPDPIENSSAPQTPSQSVITIDQ